MKNKIFYVVTLVIIIALGFGIKKLFIDDAYPRLDLGVKSTTEYRFFDPTIKTNSMIGLIDDPTKLNIINLDSFNIKTCDCNKNLVRIGVNENIIYPLNSRSKTKQRLDPLGESLFEPNVIIGHNENSKFFTSPYAPTCGQFSHAKTNPSKSKNLRIAILDSGSSISDIPINNENFEFPCGRFNYLDPADKKNVTDHYGHGSHVLSIINNPKLNNLDVNFIVYKIFGPEGKGELFDGLCALYSAIENDAKIINLSWGFYDNVSNVHEVILDALVTAKKSSAIVVMAAGNDGNNNDQIAHWPSNAYNISKYNNLVSVSALNDANELDYTRSNYGSNTVTMATNGDQCAYNHLGTPIVKFGSSMATAVITQRIANNWTNCNRGEANSLDQNCLGIDIADVTLVEKGYRINQNFTSGTSSLLTPQ